ncbi:uncharacterized protein LY89DRAFT_73602 [Mollisia scopiformis]|uniref:Uncharacterized protein n=1 Tax=Mollisia scopiformis TaxID=149040 RepID=A0A194XAK1_MOLSC|nr:uncharacterized protein LY89DRAFT_73602 [Mollisia scopiformis]KUJ17195.1 hypothetical protein LY89DRAFT_73602 [Mollisia scopiformis]
MHRQCHLHCFYSYDHLLSTPFFLSFFLSFFLLRLLISLPPYLELPQNLLRPCRKILLQLPKSQISKNSYTLAYKIMSGSLIYAPDWLRLLAFSALSIQ